ncbi:MAG: hypothetical protein Q9191_005937 [Dirinaria sp. TL-2023a]
MNKVSLRPFSRRLGTRPPISNSRAYAVQSPGTPILQVFNSNTKHLQKERAALDGEGSRKVDYLRDEDINRHFPTVLDLGANACNIARALTIPSTTSDRPVTPSTRLTHLTSAETSPRLLWRDASLPFNDRLSSHTRVELPPIDHPLPFEPQSFSAVLSSVSLHWINDLPSLLAQINHILKPDSPFIAAMLGGDSLYELRTSLQLSEQDRLGGVSTHTSPLADVRDVGGLLTKAGFKLLTVDVDDIIVDYPDTFALMKDLQAMGENNAVVGREMGPIGRDVLLASEGIYRTLHGNKDGTLPATFRIIYMIGWTAGEGQPEPLARGSGQISMTDVLGGGGGGGGGGAGTT